MNDFVIVTLDFELCALSYYLFRRASNSILLPKFIVLLGKTQKLKCSRVGKKIFVVGLAKLIASQLEHEEL